MRYLLDTHVLLWAAFRKELLSDRARHLLLSEKNEILVSAASAWEIATKFRLGKLPMARVLAEDFVAKVTGAGYLLMPITPEHALRAGRMTSEHKDPFDRMLAAQAIHEDMPLIGNDEQLDGFGVRREW